MNQILRLFACALLLSWWVGLSPGHAQTQTFTLASNLPSVHTVSTNITMLQPTNIADSSNLVAIPAGGTASYSVEWMPASIAGNPTSLSTNVKFPDTSTVSMITVRSTDSNGCIAEATIAVDYSLPISSYNSLDIDLNIYPNPNSGTFSVSLKGKPTGNGMELVVLDALGRMVYSEKLARFQGSLNKELDLSGLSKGAYFLGFHSEGKQVFKKLMIH